VEAPGDQPIRHAFSGDLEHLKLARSDAGVQPVSPDRVPKSPITI
jgi:hypothetical protein